METCSSWEVKKWLTAGGSFLVMLPIGLPWYWGNIGMYAMSYIDARGHSKAGVDTPWIISIYFMSNFFGMFISGLAKTAKTKRFSLLFGISLFTGGIFLSHFTVKISVLMLTLTIGIVSGAGGGIVNGMALRYAVPWAGKNLGLVTSFVQSGFNTGPILINPLFTLFVNPDNISPSFERGSIKLFSQPELLDRVPFAFVLLGASCLVLQLVGLIIVKEVIEKRPDEKDKLTERKTGSPRGALELESAAESTETVADKTPNEMIRTKPFFVVCVSLALFDNAMLVLANYYKDYGAVWIGDDYFLAFLGNALTIATIVGFPAWGFVSDRIGIKKTLMLMLAFSSWFCVLAFFTPMFGRLLYTVNIILLGFFLPPIFSILIVAICRMFGKTHHSTNISYTAILSLITNFVNPLVYQALVNIGWFYVFAYAAALCAANLILIALTLPGI